MKRSRTTAKHCFVNLPSGVRSATVSSGINAKAMEVVASDPECQEMILRLGTQVSDINAASISRVDYVLGVASVVRAARLR